MLYYQIPLPKVGLLDPVLYQKCFCVYKNRLRESWFLGQCVVWVIWAPGTGPAWVFYPVMNATCVTHFQSRNLSSPQFSMDINLYASTNWTGKIPRKEGFKCIFVLSIPCKLFWVFLLCILLVHKICSHGLSASHAITRSRGTLFKADELINHCFEHYRPTSSWWSILWLVGWDNTLKKKKKKENPQNPPPCTGIHYASYFSNIKRNSNVTLPLLENNLQPLILASRRQYTFTQFPLFPAAGDNPCSPNHCCEIVIYKITLPWMFSFSPEKGFGSSRDTNTHLF